MIIGTSIEIRFLVYCHRGELFTVDITLHHKPLYENPVPIHSEAEARSYLARKVERYRDLIAYKGNVAVVVDKYLGKCMNLLKASGFTYLNLYAMDSECLRDPHVAAALAFNTIAQIHDVPDDIDTEFGLTYTKVGVGD